MNIKYVGPTQDFSGYGEASRHDVAALHSVGVNITLESPKYTLEISDFGEIGDLSRSLVGREIPYDIIILHTTPNVYSKYMEPNKYHIARVFWETDKIPAEFATQIQSCNEVWTGSNFNKNALIKAGVTKPIYLVPEAIDTSIISDSVTPYQLDREQAIKSYKFYSVFEWTERKNPMALLSAYFQEFQGVDDVSLTIKTYVDNFTPEKKAEIKQSIRKLKDRLNLPSYPKLYIYNQLMDRAQIYRFHKTFDCFVSAHRGEGWGIPQMEALLMEKPIISTRCGGVHEYLRHGEDAILIDYTLTRLTQNTRNQQWYTQDQQWADVNIDQLRQALRAAYQHREQTREIGSTGSRRVRELFNFKSVGGVMLDKLQQIKLE